MCIFIYCAHVHRTLLAVVYFDVCHQSNRDPLINILRILHTWETHSYTHTDIPSCDWIGSVALFAFLKNLEMSLSFITPQSIGRFADCLATARQRVGPPNENYSFCHSSGAQWTLQLIASILKAFDRIYLRLEYVWSI